MPKTNSFTPSTDVDLATNTITITNHGLVNLDGVIYNNNFNASIGGLVHNTKYYAVVIDANNIKLGTTEVNARTSVVVDLLTQPAGSHKFISTSIYPGETSVHNIFQNFRLTGGGLTGDGETISAETVKDTLNIVGGGGVSFTSINNDSKTFTLSATQYDFEVPTGTTNLRMFSDSGDDQSIILTPARGIAITRVGSQEVSFESFGVTETDTLQSITERGNITNNKLIMDNLLVAKIESTPGVDGVVNYTTTGTTGTAIALTGNGTLDNELLFSPDYATSTEGSKDVYVNFQSPAAKGTLSYTAVYTSESSLTTGSVKLQRDTGGGYVTIDNVSGTTVDQSYEINGNYAENSSSTVDYRLVFSWTGSTDIVTYRIRVSYEVENVPGTEIILTNTDTEVLTLGTLGGTVNIRGAITVADEISTDQLTIFNNNIIALNSDTDINLEPAGAGAVQIRTNWLSTNQSYVNVFTDSQVDEVYIGSTTSLTTVNDNLRIIDDVEIRGGNLTTNQSTFNLLVDTNLTTLNIGNANTDINLGNIDINGNVFDTNDSTGITFTPSVVTQSDLTVENDLVVAHKITATDLQLSANAVIDRNLTVLGNTTVKDIEVQGGDLTTDQTTFNLLNANATTVNAFGNATTINFGSLIFTGNTVTTDDSSGITFTPAVTFESDISVGNDITVPTLIVTSELSSPIGSITNLTTSSITNNGSFGTDSLSVNTATISNDLTVSGNTVITGNLTVNGTQTTLNTTTLDVEDLNITVAKGAADAAAANGAGLTVDGANASLTYNNTDDSFVFNKQVTVNGDLYFYDNTGSTLAGSIRNDFGRLEFYNEDDTRMFYFENTQNYISVDRAVVVSSSHYLSTSEIRQSAGVSGGINIESGTSGSILLGTGTTDHELNITDGVVSVDGFLQTQGVTEEIDSKTGATGTVIHDLDVATVFYHTTPAADFTANFTNVPITNDRAISIAITIVQGATAYITNAVQVDGVAQTINWNSNATPTGTSNNLDVISFTLIRTGSAWTVMGSLSTFGT